MGIPDHVARLRAVVGHDLLVLPSVSVLITDGSRRLLLVRHAGHDDGWGLSGGIVEPEEAPADAAVREAREELGVEVRLLGLLDVLGGPDFTVTYPNADRVSYTNVVYHAEIISGDPSADLDELSAVAWFTSAELPGLTVNRSTRVILTAAGHLPDPQPHRTVLN